MLLASIISYLTDDGVALSIILAAFTTLLTGLFMMLVTRQHEKTLHKREGYLVASLGWILMTLWGCCPTFFQGCLLPFPVLF